MGNQKRYTTEKSLSDKGCTIVNLNNEDKSVYPEEDVKEFIQKLKQIIDSFGENRGEGNGLISIRIGDDFTTNSIVMFKEKLEKIIRKLAGDKLT